MKRIIFILFLVLPPPVQVFSQVFTDSNLPIVIINTDQGADIKDDPRILADMAIIYRGPGLRNYMTDRNNPLFLDYSGRIDIEIRGSSSQDSEKKSYGFSTLLPDNSTNNNVKLLGLPKENDWILNGMIFDPALIRDFLSYNLSRLAGEYASGTQYCEVIINGNYRGLYVLEEKIKADDNRVNIIKIDPSDNSFPDITGGYITKSDKTTGGDPVAWTLPSWFGTSVDFIHELPKPEDVTPSQNEYIKSRFQLLQTTSIEGETSLTDGYPSVIDIPSFINFILINELASNADGYMYSTFFHKDRNGKLRAGPVWDFDLTFGNDLFMWGYDRSKTNVWQLSNRENDGARFWKELFNNTAFRCYVSKRWNELTGPGEPLNQAGIESLIDQTVALISEGAQRDYTRWGKTGTLSQHISGIKTFLSLRIAWITSNIGSFSACENVAVPPLVITKINYHPESSAVFPDAENLEFIEITNNGDQQVDLTGIYFTGTGFVFQFPPGSDIDLRSSVILAGNESSFFSRYGFSPFSRFYRSLSNKGENLVLADAYGNVIDNVSYTDTVPWPDADGNGYYLKLRDPDLDNNIPSSWVATNEIVVSEKEIRADRQLVVYPNPADNFLNIRSVSAIIEVSLYDLSGRLIVAHIAGADSFEMDISGLSDGIYIIKIRTTNGIFTKKIVKE